MVAVPPASRDPASLQDVERWRALAAANGAAFWDHGVQAQGQRAVRWADAWAADPGSPAVIANSATLLQPLAAAQAGDLVARLGAFYSAGLGAPWVLWDPWGAPALGAWGMHLIGQPPLMVRLPGGAPPAVPPGLRVVEVEDATGLRDFEQVFITGYPVPELEPVRAGAIYDTRALGGRLRIWVGYVDDQPVTTAIAYVGPDVIGIYCVATVPAMRGHGYGAAVTDVAAAADPALPAVLQSSDLGYPVYARLGFHEVARYTLWLHSR